MEEPFEHCTIRTELADPSKQQEPYLDAIVRADHDWEHRSTHCVGNRISGRKQCKRCGIIRTQSTWVFPDAKGDEPYEGTTVVSYYMLDPMKREAQTYNGSNPYEDAFVPFE